MTKRPSISDMLLEAMRPAEPWEQMARLDQVARDYASPTPHTENDNHMPPAGEEEV